MNSKTPVELMREAMTRGSAIRAYALAHDHWSEEEQTLTAEGRHIEAAGAHEYALVCLRAYRAETDDPEPK